MADDEQATIDNLSDEVQDDDTADEVEEDEPKEVSQTVSHNIDPDVLSYLEAHSKDLTLSFLEKAHATLIQLKASDPERDFHDYIEELKHSQANYAAELAELRVAKKEAEIKFQLMKRRYDEELNSFNEIKIEHIFKNSGAKEYIERMKEKNKVKEEMISHMKRELEQKRNDLVVWQNKFHEAEEQCNVYWKAWKDTQVRKEQLEAEKRATQERENRRVLNQSMNLSSASSLVDVPPPPPVQVPSVEELLALNTYNNISMNSSIPPPPPIDVPSFNENYKCS